MNPAQLIEPNTVYEYAKLVVEHGVDRRHRFDPGLRTLLGVEVPRETVAGLEDIAGGPQSHSALTRGARRASCGGSASFQLRTFVGCSGPHRIGPERLRPLRFEPLVLQLEQPLGCVLVLLSEADDAVQEAWLRLSRSDTSGIENLRGWLTTLVARVCLDMLRSREARCDEPLGTHVAELIASSGEGTDPEPEALLADSVGLALLVVLDRLTPAERLAFVLHDMFAVPFDEIAPIVGRSPSAARQLASRARRRVQGAGTVRDGDLTGQREVVGAFLAALRG